MRALMLNFSHQEWKKQNHIIFPQPPNLVPIRHCPKNMQKKSRRKLLSRRDFDVVEKDLSSHQPYKQEGNYPNSAHILVVCEYYQRSLTIIQMSALANLDNFLDSEEADNGIRLGKARQLVCFIILYSTF